MREFSFTQAQLEAIDYAKDAVITACPGSGKTTVMVEKVRKALDELPSYQGIISITFTKKAATELKKRCKGNAYNVKQSFFGTIDSFCLKELIYPFLPHIWGKSKKEIVVKTRIDEELQNKYFGCGFSFEEELKNIEVSKNSGIKDMYNDGILCISTFPSLALHVLRSSAAAKKYIQAKYKKLFIDEYQDSSEFQHKLFLEIKSLGLVTTVVGDIDQSIYSFRGGNPVLLQSLVSDAINWKHFVLDENHRCHTSIQNYANRVLDKKAPIIETEDLRIKRYLFTGDLVKAGEIVTGWMDTLFDKGLLKKASDLVILAKKESSLQYIAQGLKVKHRLFIKTPLERIESRSSDLLSLLLAYRFGSIKTMRELYELIESNLHVHQLNYDRFISEIKSLVELSNDNFIGQLLNITDLLGLECSEIEINAVREILNNTHLINVYKPEDPTEISLMTLHQSKGLEFRVVLHFDLEEWSFPHQEVINGDWDNIVFPDLEQETNLHYVGITRASEFCCLIQVSERITSRGTSSVSRPSYFLGLPGLDGLYRS